MHRLSMLAVVVCALAGLTAQAQWAVVKGTVFAETPEGAVPLEGAVVKLMGMMTVKEDVTGPDGGYGFEEVKPGTYKLAAFKEGFLPQAKIIEVEAGQTLTVDFILKPFKPASVGGTVYGATPTGEVPLAGALVKLMGMGGELTQKTLEDGSYLFEKVKPGWYKIVALAEGYFPQAKMIEVPPGAELTVDFVLKPFEPASVGGTVYGLTPEGDEKPLAGALVKLMGMGGELAQKTLEDGSYLFEKVKPGTYKLFAAAEGYLPQAKMIELPPGAELTVDFTLEPFEPGAVGGIVLGAVPEGDPKPLEGALVKLSGMGIFKTMKTGPDGLFLFKEVPPGFYHLAAVHEGYFPQCVEIKVPPGELVEHKFVLKPLPPPPGAFGGKVLGQIDPEHQVPLPGALVQLLDAEGHVVRQTFTNWKGQFIMPKVPPGVYLAVAKKYGWLPDKAEVKIVSGEVTEHVFVLKKPGD